MVNFSDIFKKAFLEDYSGHDITVGFVFRAFLLCSIISLFIYLVYTFKTRRSFYSRELAISLVALSMITTSVILTVQSSIVISLGMVGALSIVRFRTAIKNPIDLVFLFWSISLGIICGAGLFWIAVIVSLMLGIIILGLDELPELRKPRILVVDITYPCREEKLISVMKQYCRHYKIKSRNISNGKMAQVIELSGKIKNEEELLHSLNNVDGIISVSLISQEGEICS